MVPGDDAELAPLTDGAARGMGEGHANRIMGWLQSAALRGLWRPVLAYVLSRIAVATAHLAVAAQPAFGIRDAVVVWDSAWYVTIVEGGYSTEVPTGQSNVAFFPLYPLLARAASVVPGVGRLDGLAVVALAAGLAATCLLWLLTRDLAGEEAADRSAALFAFAPGAVVFSLLYSEALFLALAIAACWALIRRRYVTGGVLCALATATRPNGVALVAVALVTATLAVTRRREWRSLVAPALAPLGFVGYLLFTWVNTGQADSWLRAQRLGWHERFSLTARFEDLGSVLGALFWGAPLDWNRLVITVGLVVAVVSFVLLLRCRPPIELVAYTVVIAVLALTSATLGLRPRFLLTAFPLTMALGIWLRSSFVFSLVLAASAGAMVALAVVTSTTNYLTP